MSEGELFRFVRVARLLTPILLYAGVMYAKVKSGVRDALALFHTVSHCVCFARVLMLFELVHCDFVWFLPLIEALAVLILLIVEVFNFLILFDCQVKLLLINYIFFSLNKSLQTKLEYLI